MVQEIIEIMNLNENKEKISCGKNLNQSQDQMIKELHLSGDHYKMGQQHGQQVRELRPQILTAIDDRLRSLSKIDANIEPSIKEISQTWELKSRSTMDMLRGIADALALNWDHYFQYTATPFILDYFKYQHHHNHGCTTWAAAAPITSHSTSILAKNRDYLPNHHELQCLAWSSPTHGYRHAYLTSAGSPGVFSSGMNEAGFAVADTYVCSDDIGLGLPRYTAMMELLEHYDNVESALHYLQAIQHTGNGTLILLDSRGDMAVFETGYSNYGILRSKERFAVSTNHFESLHKCKHWVGCVSNAYKNNSQGRYARVRQAIKSAKGEVDFAWAKELMTTHGDSFNSICRHPETDSYRSTTISSVFYLPAVRKIFLANGFPCQSEFQEWSLKE
jgi:predicted choloylglycine hydrolase